VDRDKRKGRVRKHMFSSEPLAKPLLNESTHAHMHTRAHVHTHIRTYAHKHEHIYAYMRS